MYYAEKDFLIGTTIHLHGFRFQIQSADEYTNKYMEDNTDVFVSASVEHVLNKIKHGAARFSSMQEYAIHLLRTLDLNGDGYISFDELK